MATPTIRRPSRPATAADLWRLADQGRANGVRLLSECVTGERFATSATQAGTVYRVTAYSCTCPGFCHHQRCQHHALLLSELGWLPDVAGDVAVVAAPSPVTIACLVCGGHGFEPDCTGHPTAAGRVWCECPACDGAAPRPAPRPIVAVDVDRWPLAA